MEKRHKCRFCGTATHSLVCSTCIKKLLLIRDLLKMVQNKAKEVGYFDTHKK